MPHAPLTFGIVIDSVAVLTLVFFLSRGLMHGVSGELARIVGFAGGAWAGYAFYPHIQALRLGPNVETPSVTLAITTLILAILAGFLIGWLLNYLCKAMMQVVILQPADAILGCAAGAVYTATILIVVFALAMLVPIQSTRRLFTEHSRIGQRVCPWLHAHMGLP